MSLTTVPPPVLGHPHPPHCHQKIVRNRYDTELLAHKMEKSEWSQCIVFFMTDLALLFLFCCLICCCLCMGDSACGDGGGGGAEGGAGAAAGGAGDVGNLA